VKRELFGFVLFHHRKQFERFVNTEVKQWRGAELRRFWFIRSSSGSIHTWLNHALQVFSSCVVVHSCLCDTDQTETKKERYNRKMTPLMLSPA
jgi:hypothetical protein